MIFLIYKTYYTKHGDVEKVELVEVDENETSAISFTKLYGLQIPKDLKDRIAYNYMYTKVI